ncbi:thioredoxin-disulfide reductase [Mycoplasmopsis maculosa]|uniref:Thioredoxin-disulfide reductase n=1 Tax=Mycoplasmopsis maculosa TaxID=114885 RepID=A0A449B4K3_9BACT|nr:FAD-dependent oxidoreductase [Mycoplasmopsis maculosa]VEU75495.1 thioredoxin-disulfide reductase [Mycoplasmopsis maculosa]
MENQYDVIIVGAGPAGLNCALYTSRAGLKTLIIEKNIAGGKINLTSTVENYLGIKKIDGYELAENLYNHAIEYGAEYKNGSVETINNISEYENEVILTSGTIFKGKTVVIAAGMVNRYPTGVENFEKFLKQGVSFCGVCDGPLFRNKDIIVYGGGNSAVEEALFLSQYANSIKLVVKDEEFIADKISVEEIYKNPKIEVLKSHTLKSLDGDSNLKEIELINNKNNDIIKLNADGLFPMIGFIPAKEIYKNLDISDKSGFIITDEKMETKVKSIYAIGDIRVKNVRQIVTASSDGAIAAKEIWNALK